MVEANKTIILTEKENNTTVLVEKNGQLSIKLNYVASSGYSWDSLACTAGSLANIVHDPVTNTPGGSNKVSFTFNITNDGVIVMDYARPFEPTGNPSKLFVAVVKTKTS